MGFVDRISYRTIVMLRGIVRGTFVLLMGFATAKASAEECTTCAPAAKSPKEILGPCEMPHRLAGTWKVSMCFDVVCGDTGHTWLRYQNVETGEVHTVGRYQKGHGSAVSKETGEVVYPPAPVSGVIYDVDLKRERKIRKGEIHIISCVVTNPIVFRGQNNGFGHGGIKNNCVTHVRDGWQHYTGECYDIGTHCHAPKELLDEVAKRHPEIRRGH